LGRAWEKKDRKNIVERIQRKLGTNQLKETSKKCQVNKDGWQKITQEAVNVVPGEIRKRRTKSGT
jgi:hypothetical protein